MLRNFVLLLLFIGSMNSCFSQRVSFGGSYIDSLTITFSSGYYHFDDSGTYTSTSDEWLVVFNEEKNEYRVELCNRTNSLSTFKPVSSRKTTYSINHTKRTDQAKLVNLLQQFENGDTIATFENSGITTEDFLRATRKSKIWKVLKRYRARKDFFYFYDKDERTQIYADIQNIDTFNVFLSTAFHLNQFPIITDVADDIWVEISTDSMDFKYLGKIPDTFKQPFHVMDGYFGLESILNLKINKALVAILPRKFHNLWRIQTQELMNDYIHWLLERRNAIY